jgi:hypothetical protein
LIDREDGAVSSETRAFDRFKRDIRALVAWLLTHRIQQVAMESTGIYWKSVLRILRRLLDDAGIKLGGGLSPISTACAPPKWLKA